MELWTELPIELELNKYLISTLGRIENKETGHILTPGLKDGYYRIGLVHNDNKPRKHYVHRLVAITFIPNPENKPTVNHKNPFALTSQCKGRNDNSVHNLEWATAQEQNTHKTSNSDRPGRKIRQYRRDGSLIKIWNSISDVRTEVPNIYRYLKGKAEHQDYIFKYDAFVMH